MYQLPRLTAVQGSVSGGDRGSLETSHGYVSDEKRSCNEYLALFQDDTDVKIAHQCTMNVVDACTIDGDES